jgi:hypothetical protein
MMCVWYAAATACSSNFACWETVPHLLGLHLGKQPLEYSRCKSCASWQAAGSGRHISEHGVCLACMSMKRQAGPWRCYGITSSVLRSLMRGPSNAGSPEDVAPYARTQELNPAMTFVTIGRPTTAVGTSSDWHLVL